MCGRVSRPVRVFSPMIARAGRLWRAVPTCSIGVLHFRLVAGPGRAVKSVAFLFSAFQFFVDNAGDFLIGATSIQESAIDKQGRRSLDPCRCAGAQVFLNLVSVTCRLQAGAECADIEPQFACSILQVLVFEVALVVK